MPTWCKDCRYRWAQPRHDGCCRHCARLRGDVRGVRAFDLERLARQQARWRQAEDVAPPVVVSSPGRTIVDQGVEYEVVWDGR